MSSFTKIAIVALAGSVAAQGVTSATASTSSAYQCNPAHSYPDGVQCDATARTLIYPSTSGYSNSTVAAGAAVATVNAVYTTYVTTVSRHLGIHYSQ